MYYHAKTIRSGVPMKSVSKTGEKLLSYEQQETWLRESASLFVYLKSLVF